MCNSRPSQHVRSSRVEGARLRPCPPPLHLEHQAGKGDAHRHAELGDSDAAVVGPPGRRGVAHAAAQQPAGGGACMEEVK